MFNALARPLLFAHRGASLRAPENTLAAFELGARLGANVLELDVHGSADGEVVVFHDRRVERTTNGHGFIRDMTYGEIAQLDAGYHFRQHGDYPFRGHGMTAPRLQEVLNAFPKMGFNIEIKQHSPSIIDRVLRILDAAGPTEVLLTAGDHAIMQQLEAAKPGCPLGLSKTQVLQVLRGAYGGRIPEAFRGRALQIPPRVRGILPVATGAVIKAAQRAGIDVHIWTINNLKTAHRWLERGVDGIMSDDPGLLAGLFADFRESRSTAP